MMHALLDSFQHLYCYLNENTMNFPFYFWIKNIFREIINILLFYWCWKRSVIHECPIQIKPLNSVKQSTNQAYFNNVKIPSDAVINQVINQSTNCGFLFIIFIIFMCDFYFWKVFEFFEIFFIFNRWWGRLWSMCPYLHDTRSSKRARSFLVIMHRQPPARL